MSTENLTALLTAIATDILKRHELSAPIDPEIVAIELGLRVYHSDGCTGLLIGRDIIVDEADPFRESVIAHEIGHWIVRDAGLGTYDAREEERADIVARALIGERYLTAAEALALAKTG